MHVLFCYAGYGMPPPSRAPPDPSSYTYSTPNAKDFPSREATPDHSSSASSSSVPVYTQNSKKYDKVSVEYMYELVLNFYFITMLH